MVVNQCERCPDLVESRTQIVNGVGPRDADLMFVGEAPGETEDRRGEPFVGRSGDRLDSVLGDRRDDVFITNTVRCRPSENRDPTESECSHCLSHLDDEIDIVDPELIVLMGSTAIETIVGSTHSPVSDCGEIVETKRGRCMICIHPTATFYRTDWHDQFVEAIERVI